MNPHKLKRGMLIQHPDGHVERIVATERLPAFRRKGRRVYALRDSAFNTLNPGIKVLGFVKP